MLYFRLKGKKNLLNLLNKLKLLKQKLLKHKLMQMLLKRKD